MKYTDKDLETMFKYHPATGMQPGLYGAVRSGALSLATLINSMCPDSFEKDEAIKALNTVMFWANASIARHSTEEVVDGP